MQTYDNSDDNLADFYNRYDDEFEEFAEKSGFLTNFPDYHLPQYQNAVALGAVMFPDIEMVIGKGWKHTNYALYIVAGRQDLSDWWRMFDSCKVGE